MKKLGPRQENIQEAITFLKRANGNIEGALKLIKRRSPILLVGRLILTKLQICYSVEELQGLTKKKKS